MATTDKSEWILLDTDLTTRLSILPVGGSSHQYYEINEPGSGELKIPLDSTAAGLITAGMFCECYYRGSIRGGFFVDNLKEAQVDASEAGGRWLSVSGRGALALLEDAIVWDDGTTSTTREFTSQPKAAILKTLIDEAQARGALANLTYDFTATDDSASTAWTDSESYKLPVGTSLLDVARQFATTGGFDFAINLVAGSFVLSAYAAGLGSNKAETIFLRSGTNCEEVTADERANDLRNATRVKYKAGYITVSDATSISTYRRRESLLSLEQAQTSASASTYASARLANTKDPRKSIAVRVYDGVKPYLFVDYVMGDYITLDVRGVELVYRVLGIQADFDGFDYSNVVLELNTILYDSQMDMEQELAWLQDQWATANDGNLTEVSFWALIGYPDEITAMWEYNGLIYLGGALQSTPTGISYANRSCLFSYNPTTGLFSNVGVFPGTSVNAIINIGTSLYVVGGDLDIWEYAVGVWSSIGTVVNSGTFVLRTLATDGTNLYVGGQGISTIDGVAIACDVAKWDGVNWTSVGAANDTLFCYALIWFNGELYGGFDWDGSASSSFQKFSGGAWSVVQSATDGVLALGATSTQLVISEDEKIYLWDGVAATWTLIATLTGFASGLAIATNLEDIYLGGKFTAIDGVPINRLAKYSGGAWSALGTGPTAGFSGNAINELVYSTGGDLYIGGTFYTLNGLSVYNFAAYMTDFNNMTNFLQNTNSSVNWGDIGGTLSEQVDLQAALDAKPDYSFQTIAVSGQSDIVADAEADTLTLVAGTGITLTTNAGADALTITASGTGGISGTGVVGQLAEWVTDTSTLQAAKIIGPAANILTITNAAASTLALNIATAKVLTLTSADNYTIVFPASLTVAGLAIQNVFTANQFIDGSADAIQFRIQAHSTQTNRIQTWENSAGLVYGFVAGSAAADGRIGSLIWNYGSDISNTFIGYAAGGNNLNASALGNVCIGWSAGTALAFTSGSDSSYNMLFGSGAGVKITRGNNNVAVGANSLAVLTTQAYCTAIGTQALKNTTGPSNVGISFDAGASITSGQSNIAIGAQALAGGTVTGHRNIVIGFNAGYYLTGSGSDQLLIDKETRANAAQEVQQAPMYANMASGGYVAHNIGTTTNNAVKEVLRLQAFVDTASTGSANGFGPALNLYGETATDLTYQQMAQIAAAYVDSTNATFKSDLVFSAKDAGGLREGIRISADGTGAVVNLKGGQIRPYVSKTADYTLTRNDYAVDVTANSVNITLPTAVGFTGQIFYIKNSGTGTVTMLTTSSQTIDGAASGTVLLYQYDCLTVMSDNANWKVI